MMDVQSERQRLDERGQSGPDLYPADQPASHDLLPRTLEVACMIEIERSRETLFAHVALAGVAVNEGDVVIVHDAPTRIGFGERLTHRSRATVAKASVVGRFFTRCRSYLELTELYEVGFQPKE